MKHDLPLWRSVADSAINRGRQKYPRNTDFNALSEMCADAMCEAGTKEDVVVILEALLTNASRGFLRKNGDAPQ